MSGGKTKTAKAVQYKSRETTMKSSKTVTRDPVCGMEMDEKTALRAERDGKKFYFCGADCREKFLSTRPGAKTVETPGGCCG